MNFRRKLVWVLGLSQVLQKCHMRVHITLSVRVGFSTGVLQGKGWTHGSQRSDHKLVYRGQITVLLGHNGAGKTTTCGMLTDMCVGSALLRKCWRNCWSRSRCFGSISPHQISLASLFVVCFFTIYVVVPGCSHYSVAGKGNLWLFWSIWGT